jgi:hypothetical protein
VYEKAGSHESYEARIEFKKARTNDDGSDERKSEPSYHHVSAWCKCLERETSVKKG